MDDALAKKLRQHAADGALVLFMGAGDIDTWARQYAANS
jgi:UDP-N-acetylmuramate-alanine ligase